MADSTPRKTTEAYYDDFATAYDLPRDKGYHAMLDALELEVLRPLASGRDVLEVGCGTGLLMKELSGISKTLKGIDVSEGMLAPARQRGLQVALGSATEIPFGDEEFDLVFSMKVLAHVPDLPTALAEMARVTRSGGFVVAELYNPLSLRYLAKRIAGPQKISDTRTEADVYTRWDMADVFERAAPPSLVLQEKVGVRVLTPFAAAHRVPKLGGLLRKAEHWALRSPLRHFGGFMLGVYRKS